MIGLRRFVIKPKYQPNLNHKNRLYNTKSTLKNILAKPFGKIRVLASKENISILYNRILHNLNPVVLFQDLSGLFKGISKGTKSFVANFKDPEYKYNVFKIFNSIKHNLVPRYAEDEPARAYAWKDLAWPKHVGILLLVVFIWFGNYISSKPKQNAGAFNSLDIASVVDTEAISKNDLTKTVKAVVKYTPLVKEDPKAIAAKLIGESDVQMTSDSYIIKPKLVLTESQIVLATADNSSSSTETQPKETITKYTVLEGDTLGIIAAKYGISVADVKSSNGLTSDFIRPGHVLDIPTSTGVVYTVAKGDTLIGIVSRYSGNLQKTIALNNLGTADRIYSGQKLLIADGTKPAPTATRAIASNNTSSSRSTTSSSGSVAGITVNRSSGPNRFPYGWCTWWVASKRYVPWRGNANQWPANARAYGYAVGRVPVPGAILVTNESWWGHVAYVESVHGSTITISEMNYVGWGRVSTRTLPAGYGIYIY